MKNLSVRVMAFCLLVALAFGLAAPAYAAVSGPDAGIQASEYFVRKGITATSVGDGKVQIKINVEATATMQELGASKVTVYEKQADGSYSPVHTYTRYNADLIKTNRASNIINLTYQGKTGKYYYITASCYAKNASGYQESIVGSSAVKA